MAIDPLTEQLRSFAEAAGRLPALRGGKSVNPSTVWRWTKRGVRARNGVRIRLEAIKVGGTGCTSDQALLRFFRALSDDQESCVSGHSVAGEADQPTVHRRTTT
jgi:hypothetical protein